MAKSNIHELNPQPLVVAISSRALFNLDESHEVFESEGLEAYADYQVARENDFLQEGVAFPLVKKLLALNDDDISHQGVEVILMSRNSADSGFGESPFRYMKAHGTQLFLSSHEEDVREALQAGFAAAMILPGKHNRPDSGQLRIAFDGDAVLFSDEAERVYQAEGLEAFAEREKNQADTPLPGGPFKPLLQALQRIQSAYSIDNNPIRTALVTARSAPAHKRVILTLREWGIRIDEALFLGGKAKGPFLAAFGADIFFDDQQVHCESAREHVPTGHVPNGIRNL